MRLLFIIAAWVLFLGSYSICEVFYSAEINKWDSLRHGLYMLNLALYGGAMASRVNTHLDRFVTLLNFTFIWWALIPSALGRMAGETDVTSLDIISIFVGAYLGMKDIFPETHRDISLYVMTESAYNRIFKRKK